MTDLAVCYYDLSIFKAVFFVHFVHHKNDEMFIVITLVTQQWEMVIVYYVAAYKLPTAYEKNNGWIVEATHLFDICLPTLYSSFVPGKRAAWTDCESCPYLPSRS